MRDYTFEYLDAFGELLDTQTVQALDDAQALEFAKLIDFSHSIRIFYLKRHVRTIISPEWHVTHE